MEYLASAPTMMLGLAAFVAVLFLIFLILVPGRGFRLWLRMHRIVRSLQTQAGSSSFDPAELFAADPVLAHLWSEYSETLHPQKAVNPTTGVQEIVAYRATVPAETYFSPQALVDTRVFGEFFRHMPGVFTGIGIIGTFSGLIVGLQAFKVSENPNEVRDSLGALLSGVMEAFYFSAAAIGAAMLATFLEKITVAALYRKAEHLAQAIDRLYEAGAGEEYLARLVKASEDSASQTKILKDALVADLKEMLSELTNQQIQAAASNNQMMAEHIAGSLRTGLEEPLTRIAGAVDRASSNQGDAVNQLLTDVLAGFSQRLQELFGGQISGINELQQQTIAALQSAVSRMEHMAHEVDAAGQRATASMASKLTEAIAGVEARQQVMNERMSEFVEQIRAMTRDGQAETNRSLQSAVDELGQKVVAMVDTLQEQTLTAVGKHAEREGALAERAMEATSTLSAQIEGVLREVANSTSELKSSVAAIANAATDAIRGMNSGAETLMVAASEFAKAGGGVTGALQQAGILSDKLSQSAGTVAESSRALQGAVSEYRAASGVVAKFAEELKETVELARKEASITADVLARMQGAADKLSAAQKDVETYLESVSEVLGEAHETFAANVRKTLGEANRQFHEQLTKSTSLLNDGIQELAAAIELPVRAS